MRRLAPIAIAAVALAPACARGPDAPPPSAHPADVRPSPTDATVAFAHGLADAIAAGDRAAAAARFTDDATATLVGDGATATGRPAIERALGALLASHDSLTVTPGRIWVGADASVIEVVLAGTRRAGPLMGTDAPARPVGVVAAAVVALAPDGRARTLRLYVDVATIVGQIDPGRLPEGARVRAVVTAPPAGTAVYASAGTATETRRLAITNRIWAGMDAHDPVAVMAPAAATYVYEDFSGPAPLDRDGTGLLVARFLRMVPDFHIARRPVQLAAGDDVVTEMVEEMTIRGRPVVLHGLDVKRFAGDQVVAEWQYASYPEVLHQFAGVPMLHPW